MGRSARQQLARRTTGKIVGAAAKVTAEIAGVAAATALTVVCAVNVVLSFDGFEQWGRTLLGAAVTVALVVVLRLPTAGSPRPAGGRYVTVTGHGHGGGPRELAVHEGGHSTAARHLGGRVELATITPNGRSGLVDACFPVDDPVTVVAFLLAGQRAARTSRGAGGDNALIDVELARLPAGQRAQVRREADAKARSIVFWRDGEIRRDADRLVRDGRL